MKWPIFCPLSLSLSLWRKSKYFDQLHFYYYLPVDPRPQKSSMKLSLSAIHTTDWLARPIPKRGSANPNQRLGYVLLGWKVGAMITQHNSSGIVAESSTDLWVLLWGLKVTRSRIISLQYIDGIRFRNIHPSTITKATATVQMSLPPAWFDC